MQINGDFTWEKVLGVKEEKGKTEKNNKVAKEEAKDEAQSRWWNLKSKKTTTQERLPSTMDHSEITDDGNSNGSREKQEEPPFSLNDLRFEVPKGAFVAIVGPVGCGKVSPEITCP